MGSPRGPPMGSPGGPMPLGPPWGPFYSQILSFYSQILSFYSQILSFITKKYRFTVGNQKIQIYGRLPSRKKIFAGFAGENFFPPSRSNSGGLFFTFFYPKNIDLRSASLLEKNFRGFAAKIFFRFTVEFWRYSAGVPGPPTLPRRGPWGPPRLVSLRRKNSRALARVTFF